MMVIMLSTVFYLFLCVRISNDLVAAPDLPGWGPVGHCASPIQNIETSSGISNCISEISFSKLRTHADNENESEYSGLCPKQNFKTNSTLRAPSSLIREV